MLFRFRTLYDYLIKYEFKLAHIVPVCPGYDYRQGDATLGH
jgi:hypothetical protein